MRLRSAGAATSLAPVDLLQWRRFFRNFCASQPSVARLRFRVYGYCPCALRAFRSPPRARGVTVTAQEYPQFLRPEIDFAQ